MTKSRFFRSFIALTLLAASWAVSFHYHKKEEAGARETCVVCVAGHQLKSGAGTALDKAEAPLFCAFESVRFVQEIQKVTTFRLHSSRAPPVA